MALDVSIPVKNIFYNGKVISIKGRGGAYDITFKANEDGTQTLYVVDSQGHALDPAGIAFGTDKVAPDVIYKIGKNWLADLVAVVQTMAGKMSDMTLEDILYWLNRVKYIPQGNASGECTIPLIFSPCSASGKIPEYQKGIAKSTFALPVGIFSSSAVGELT